jgi:ABC-type sulfate/molybdate transport systems ATPase subunit
VWFDACRDRDMPPEARRVGYLPQDYGLFPHMTVAGNVRFAARRPRGDLLERLGIAHLADARPLELSGGERQRAALARALARDPGLLLLDEPFGALDAITRRAVRDELAGLLAAVELPTVLVTHAFADAVALADRVGVLVAGKIVQLNVPEVVQRRPANALVAELTGANVLAGVAVPTGRGARVELAGGGSLLSTMRAEGPVELAVAPWSLRLVGPGQGSLGGRVQSVHREGGVFVVRLDRLTVHVPAGDGRAPAPGERVDVNALAEDVRVLERETSEAVSGVSALRQPPSRGGQPR